MAKRQRKRSISKEFADLAATLREIDKFDEREKRKGEKREKAADQVVKRRHRVRRARPRSERRKENRLQLLPANRTCPRCGKIKLKSKQWVCRKGKPAICKSCHLL